jgi:hypothetical protein
MRNRKIQGVAVIALAHCLAAGPMVAEATEYKAALNGASEVPPVATSATGLVNMTLEPKSRIISWMAKFGGLSGPVTAAHFHGPAAAGANAPPIIAVPDGVLLSPMIGIATLSQAQVDALDAGKIYFNIHTAAHPGGEIRGQLLPVK